MVVELAVGAVAVAVGVAAGMVEAGVERLDTLNKTRTRRMAVDRRCTDTTDRDGRTIHRKRNPHQLPPLVEEDWEWRLLRLKAVDQRQRAIFHFGR